MAEPTGPRATVKRGLAWFGTKGAAEGATFLIYHRVGGGTPDERDLPGPDFEAQMDELTRHRVVPIDQAMQELADGDRRQKVVITFDDGFADVADPVLRILAERDLPFTLYLATGYVGGMMHWDGSTAKAPGPALTWQQCEALADSGLCTFGNHTHTHARPELLSEEELDRCSDEIEARLGSRPRHFAYTWGVPVPAMEPALRARFDSAATGLLGRNLPGDDPLALKRIPVRGSDPLPFFRAKLNANLLPERAYAAITSAAKAAGVRA